MLIVSALGLLLAAQAGWSVATTSGTYDETTYLGYGRAAYRSFDMAPLAEWGIAPLPVLLTTAAPAIAGWPAYPRAVTLARLSAIALFGIPLVAVTYWTLLRASGAGAAIAGTALVALSPNIVAHTAVATTDVCFIVTALVFLEALVSDLETPSRWTCALVGASLTLALAAKYSALALFGIAALAWMTRRPIVRALLLTGGLLAGALGFVWVLHGLALVPYGLPPIETVRLPAALVGIARQVHHQALGEPSFLFGVRSRGTWFHMPAALALKSTPSELLITAVALASMTHGWRRPTPRQLVWRLAFVVFAIGALANRLSLSVRYVLIFIPLGIFLAAESCARASARWRLVAAIGLVALQLWSAGSIAPHDLSYFNAWAGGPARGYTKLADSNVDWGQDLPALRIELSRLGAKHPLLAYFGTAPQEAYGVYADPWDARVQAPFERWDWLAISATNVDGVYLTADPFTDFRQLAPDGRAGYSILLYSTSRPDVRHAMATAVARSQ